MTEIATTPTADPPLYRWRWLALVAVLTAEIMDLLDATIVGVAAPSIRADLGGDSTVIQWIAAGYTLAFAVGLSPAAGSATSTGRRRMFLGGLAGFVVDVRAVRPRRLAGDADRQPGAAGTVRRGADPAGLRDHQVDLPAARARRGVRRRSARRWGCPPWAGRSSPARSSHGTSVALGWRTVFLINVPIGLACLALAWKVLPESRADDGPRPDPLGMLLVSAGLVLLVFPLVQGRELGWPAWVFCDDRRICAGARSVRAAPGAP